MYKEPFLLRRLPCTFLNRWPQTEIAYTIQLCENRCGPVVQGLPDVWWIRDQTLVVDNLDL